jgi:uncharacterized membrane protein YkoI
VNEKLSRVMVLASVMITVIIVVAIALVASDIPEGSSNELRKEELVSAGNANNTTNSINKIKNLKHILSPAEAQKMAKKYIKEPGVSLGTPELKEIDDETVYVVPVVTNGTNVGEITINAITGENRGGTGGVS